MIKVSHDLSVKILFWKAPKSVTPLSKQHEKYSPNWLEKKFKKWKSLDLNWVINKSIKGNCCDSLIWYTKYGLQAFAVWFWFSDVFILSIIHLVVNCLLQADKWLGTSVNLARGTFFITGQHYRKKNTAQKKRTQLFNCMHGEGKPSNFCLFSIWITPPLL